MFLNCIAVGLGGFLGALLRYLIGLFPVRETTLFPIKTFLVNLTGCLAIALIAAAARERELHPFWILFLKIGICGGFTTFSTFAAESAGLFQNGHPWISLVYIALSVLLGVGLVFFVSGGNR